MLHAFIYVRMMHFAVWSFFQFRLRFSFVIAGAAAMTVFISDNWACVNGKSRALLLLLLLLLLYRTQSTHKKHITQHRTTSNNKQRSQTLKKKLFNIYY